MARNKLNKSLIQQVKENLDSKLAIGQSKYLAKLENKHTEGIFSWSSYRSYVKFSCTFVKWAKAQPIDTALGHKPRTLDECRIFAERWIKNEIDRGMSAYTIRLEVSSIAKLFGCRSRDFGVELPPRRRQNIKRSRGTAVRDKNFSFSNNRELVTLCRCSGLRRAELREIRGTDLIEDNGNLYLNIHKGTKGGRIRISPLVGSEEELEIVKKLCAEAGEGKIFPNPNGNADVHSFRADYAQRIYNKNKREYKDFKNERLIIYKNKVVDSYISKNGRRDVDKFSHLYTSERGRRRMLPGYRDVSSAYCCKVDRKGERYDRRALFEASNALGHSRECIVAEHYLHG